MKGTNRGGSFIGKIPVVNEGECIFRGVCVEICAEVFQLNNESILLQEAQALEEIALAERSSTKKILY
jgi:hypothetical protein